MNAPVETWKQVAGPLNRLGKAARARGITLQYHNHAHEFVKYGDKYALEILLGETDPRWVRSQLDVGWVTRAGQDPVKWMKKLGKRIATIHLKDTTKGPKPQWTEVGTGVLPLKAVVAQGKKMKIPWFVVEQDTWDIPSTTSAAISYAHAKQVIG
jgi:sugar phosphate isomerase/epimerase